MGANVNQFKEQKMGFIVCWLVIGIACFAIPDSREWSMGLGLSYFILTGTILLFGGIVNAVFGGGKDN